MLFRALSILSIGELAASGFPDGILTTCGLICAETGAGVPGVATIAGVPLDLMAGNVLFLNRNQSVRLAFPKDRPRLFFISLKINHVDYQKALEDMIFSFPMDADFFELVRQAADTGAMIFPDSLDRMVNAVLADSIRLSGGCELPALPAETSTARMRGFYSALYRYLDTNLQNDITVSQLAAAVGCSVRQLNAHLQRNSRCTVCEFINQYRIECAKQYLLSTSLTVTEIASLVGFKSIHYFSRMFKREEGVPPQAFRRGEAARAAFSAKHAN